LFRIRTSYWFGTGKLEMKRIVKFYFILKDRLISTIIIDPPFSQPCFLITNRQFVPNVLYIGQVEFFFKIFVFKNKNFLE